jgi:hypothetical protein
MRHSSLDQAAETWSNKSRSSSLSPSKSMTRDRNHYLEYCLLFVRQTAKTCRTTSPVFVDAFAHIVIAGRLKRVSISSIRFLLLLEAC